MRRIQLFGTHLLGWILLGAQSAPAGVVIHEIHYEPEDNTSREEFIELYNDGPDEVDVTGWFFSSGVSFEFPAGSRIAAGGYAVVAEDPGALRSAFGGVSAYGPFDGSLSNDGERVVLRSAAGDTVDEVDYGVGFPWPLDSAGDGSSMELIHPGLDNDLGGSWRASGRFDLPLSDRITIIDDSSSDWHYRKGTSEASSPVGAWRQLEFTEDATWAVGQSLIGYGYGNENTVLDDMRYNYSSVFLRHRFRLDALGSMPSLLKLDLFVDDGAVVWINGVEVARVRLDGGDPTFDQTAQVGIEAAWEEVFIPEANRFLQAVDNVLAVQVFNSRLTNTDAALDARLVIPGSEDTNPDAQRRPTPGALNSVYSTHSPPQIRQVQHLAAQPPALEPNIITAKVTDPEGVDSVVLEYQVVRPGEHVPAKLPVPLSSLLQNAEQPRPENPEFEAPARWIEKAMVDDGTKGDPIAGDGVYTAIVPGQDNRVLVRYRIRASDSTGASVRVPYADDPSLNFAYFVYDGVPDYEARTSILGSSTLHPSEALTSVPVYILLTREQDIRQAIAANSADQIPQFNQARFSFNWEGTFIYDGRVYDHVTYRLRGANGRYQVPPGNPSNTAGKRHFRFRFRKGNFLRARDKWGQLYPRPWRVLNTGRMFGNRLDGNWGLGDQVNDIIWNAYDVPAASGHVFHWRVVDGPEEAPGGTQGQYLGDFWGIERAFENYDVRFLEAHDLAKGNLYKLVNQTTVGLEQQRYQAPYAVSDGSDHDNIERFLRRERPEDWLLAYVNYDEWYRYHSIAQALRHYDYWPEANKNAAWYFEPVYTPENSFLGRMWTLPFDADATWGPTWNAGIDRPYDAIMNKPEFLKEYRNHVREIRDLLWQRDQLAQIIRQTAAFMDPLEEADIDRWRNGPTEAGRQYFGATSQRDLEGKSADMLRFAFDGGSWPGGDVGAGGRASFLDSFADGSYRGQIPDTPTIEYTGPAGFPVDGLTFRAGPFSDPQGSGTLSSVQWRLAEVSDIPNAESTPLSDPVWKEAPVHLELETTWTNGEIAGLDRDQTMPVEGVKIGARYRVRVRVKDETNLWSHWSEPIEFTTGLPSVTPPEVEDLRITEILYHPLGGSDFEFIELQNVGSRTLDLRHVHFSQGIEFRFADSAVTTLGPGEFVVLVKDLVVFSLRYDTSAMQIAGEYDARLGNAGERIVLSWGEGLDIGEYSFVDTWYPETDGLGYSLNLKDPSSPPETWTTKDAWFAGTQLHGTPGAADPGPGAGGLVLPGDANRDGTLDVSDAVALLNVLFLGQGEPPCPGGLTPGSPSLKVLDSDADGELNITDAIRTLQFLFLGGPPHVLGLRCVPIAGCPDLCAEP